MTQEQQKLTILFKNKNKKTYHTFRIKNKWIDISLEKTYQSPISTSKDVQYHELSGKCESSCFF